MALRSGLSIWAYTSPLAIATQPLVVREYAEAIENLRFSSVIPGGFGQLTAQLKVKDARIPRPELGIFSRLALMDGLDPVWLGEISMSQPSLAEDSENLQITALGLGASLRDDPNVFSYSAQTVQQVAKAQVTFHNVTYATWFLDPDTSLLFPDNPAGTYAPVYDGKTCEEIFGDLCSLASGGGSAVYVYGTQAHATNRDIAGFPTTQLYAIQRDTSTVHYQASLAAGEVDRYNYGQSTDRCYNGVAIRYLDAATATGLGTKFAFDTRLNQTTFAQNTAPFRFRKYFRDLSGTTTIAAGQAQALANLYLAQYQNPTNQSEVWLKAARDANGNRVPLHKLRAGRNILIPEMAVRGQQLPTVPTAGVNLGYIVSCEYSEDATSAQVDLQLDNWSDRASFYLDRLTLAADVLARSDTVVANVQSPNAPETGYCGGTFIATAGGQQGSDGQNYKTVMASAPSSITLTTVSSSNATSPGTNNIDVYGFNVTWNSSTSGQSTYLAHYKTNGNTLLEVRDDGTFDWHCDGCQGRHVALHNCLGCDDCHERAVHRGLTLKSHMRVGRMPAGGQHGDQEMTITCPSCGMVEAFNCNLGPEREDARECGEEQAKKARLIRRAMAHPHVGLLVRN